MLKKIRIENKVIGGNQSCFIIGEIGSNHNRDKRTVKRLIDAASKAKFDAVKFQVYDPEEAFSKFVTTADVGLKHLYGNGPWWKIARDKILMPRSWFKEMFGYARKKNLIPFSAVHNIKDAKFLLDLGINVFKIASIDCNHLPLIKQIAKFNKPMIISTGMARIDEIDETMKTLDRLGNKKIALLHCVSCYPPRNEIINLKNIQMLKERYDCIVGFSDHSISNSFSVAAVALGARIIEKHITLDRKTKGPDHPFALEPNDMESLVESIRAVEKALGNKERVLSKDELMARKMIRRSVVAKTDIKKGEAVTLKKVKFARPGTGLSPNNFKQIEGKKALMPIPAETIISERMLK